MLRRDERDDLYGVPMIDTKVQQLDQGENNIFYDF